MTNKGEEFAHYGEGMSEPINFTDGLLQRMYSADALKNQGYEVYTTIPDEQGDVHEIGLEDHSFEPTDEPGKHLLKIGKLAAGVLVTGAAITLAAKSIRQRKRN